MILKNKIIAGLIAMSAANTWAVELPVINPSFEILSRPLEIGEQTNGAAGDGTQVAAWFPWPGSPTSWNNPVEVSGWRTREVPQGSPDWILAGVLNPPVFQGQPFITEQDGQNVFAIQASQAGQSINALLEPDTRYRVDYLAGIGLNDLEYSPGFTLTAVDDLQRLPLENSPGVQRLAAMPFVEIESSTFGTMRPFVFEYTTPEVLPPELEGRYIGINLYGSDGVPRMLYDDIRLHALSPLVCDFDDSGDCDATDIDDLFSQGPISSGVAVNASNARFDVTVDSVIDLADRDAWLAEAATHAGLASPYKLGDANLDGVVDGQDFIAWSQAKFTSTLLWTGGNFDGDNAVDGQDFLLWNANKFTSSAPLTIPEPNLAWLAILVAANVARRVRFGKRGLSSTTFSMSFIERGQL